VSCVLCVVNNSKIYLFFFFSSHCQLSALSEYRIRFNDVIVRVVLVDVLEAQWWLDMDENLFKCNAIVYYIMK